MVTTILPVSLNDVTVRKRGKTLLGPVDLLLGTQGFTIVLGPNGAGKTTLLKALHGLERLSQGAVTWSAPPDEVRTKQAYVFQTPVMLRRSVRANLAYPLTLLKHSKAEIDRAVTFWAKQIDLTDLLDQPATRLSGGERQKLAMARALIREPEILFLDEPCSNLDGRSVREIEALLKAAQAAGTRIVMATHDLGQAKRLATEVVFLFRGKILEKAPAPQVFDTPQTAQLRLFLNGDILE